MPLSIIILGVVFVAIAFRQWLRLPLPIWAIMSVGAIGVLITKQITPNQALQSINVDVIGYLFGVFTLCQAAELCGYLEHVTDKLFYQVKTGHQALLVILFVLGLSSVFLMNDTIAIVGTPIILQLCRAHKALTKPLLLGLAYAITIGSVCSPIGNPQNLLIALEGNITAPFFTFLKVLALPTVINLFIAFLLLAFCFRKRLSETIQKPSPVKTYDSQAARIVQGAFAIMFLLIVLKLFEAMLPFAVSFSLIALLPAMVVLFFNHDKIKLLKTIDWGTILFFISMFILMQSVWDSQYFQTHLQTWQLDVTHINVIFLVSIVLSQLISNVPLVALYLPLLPTGTPDVAGLMALAAGSTIAGNLTLLGAASNIIILHNAEKRGDKGFGFFTFMAVGLPLTMLNVLVYKLFL